MVDASRLDWDLGGHLVGKWDRKGPSRVLSSRSV